MTIKQKQQACARHAAIYKTNLKKDGTYYHRDNWSSTSLNPDKSPYFIEHVTHNTNLALQWNMQTSTVAYYMEPGGYWCRQRLRD